MKNLKNCLVKKSMKMVGCLALFLGVLAITPASFASGHQPKCPDELLK